MEALMEHADARWFAGRKVLSVGPTTTETLRGFGLRADASVDSHGGIQALAEALPEGITGRFLYPCSDAAPTAERIETLKARGIALRPVCFYRNEPTPVRLLPATPFHRVLFTSGSTVKSYFQRYPEELKADRIWMAVGPSTLAALKAHPLDARRMMML
jgi:uroporphyrinogen-III synthase